MGIARAPRQHLLCMVIYRQILTQAWKREQELRIHVQIQENQLTSGSARSTLTRVRDSESAEGRLFFPSCLLASLEFRP